jgi:hypothetical protein
MRVATLRGAPSILPAQSAYDADCRGHSDLTRESKLLNYKLGEESLYRKERLQMHHQRGELAFQCVAHI